jgi:hypothetical protein
MRWWCLLAIGALSFFAAVSCDDESDDDGDCDRIDKHCRTVCNYYEYSCDSAWGCCHDQCWYSCSSNGTNKPAEGSSEAPPPSSSNPPSTPPSGGDAAIGPVKGVLCSLCTSNDDCQTGATCIQPGADDAGAGSGSFCGHPCADSAKDCPVGFSCTLVGGSMQCTPNDGTCD